ncbi:SpoIIE family protein phosphatase [Kineococcus gynurae]|uniref:SpoIIE family protein phosphatase n=1 Tax=Kineococcus gynurae TaxID=452979 RepID=A0ABV5LS16_9ACTN
MSDRPPVLGDGQAPAALLLVRPEVRASGLPGLSATVLAADAQALHWSGGARLPRDLDEWLAAAGIEGPGAGPDPWTDVVLGRAVPGRPLPGGRWLFATPTGAGEVLVEVSQLLGPGQTLLPDPGLVLHRRTTGPGTTRSATTGDFTVVWASGAFSRATGVAPKDVAGRGLRELVHERAAPTFWQDADRQVGRGEPVATRVLDSRDDGGTFLHRVQIVPLLDAAGEVSHLVSRHADVTATVLAEERLRGAQVAADAAGRRLDVVARLDDAAARSTPEAFTAIATVLLDAGLASEALVVLTGEGPFVPAGSAGEVVAAVGPTWAGLHGRSLGHRPDGVERVGERPDDASRPVPAPLPARAGEPGSPPARTLELLEEVGSHAAGPPWVVAAGSGDDAVGLLVVRPTPSRPEHPDRRRPGPELAPHDASVLVAAARRVGAVAERARWQARETSLAQTLQRSLLPQPVRVEGLEVWSHVAAEVEPARVGGDWCDVVQTSPDHVAVVVGDVVGHDAEAAAAMGRMRTVVRSSLADLDDPGAVLARVDQHSSRLGLGRPASLVLASLHRLDDGDWELSWSSAGHLPPLLRRASGHVEVLSEGTGTLVGVGSGRPRPTRHRALFPGDTLVFFTDGLIETRGREVHDGLAALIKAVSDSFADAAAGVGEELLDILGAAPEDDTAVVVVRVPAKPRPGSPDGAAPVPRRRRWLLRADPSSIGKARHATLRACAAWELEVGLQAEMVVSELVANAVLHGWGDVGLRLFDLDDRLRIEVEDDSPEHPRLVDARPEGTGGHGMRVVASLGDWGTTRTARGKIVWVEIPLARPPAPACT